MSKTYTLANDRDKHEIRREENAIFVEKFLPIFKTENNLNTK